GQTSTSIDILGGNQSDAVNIRQMPKHRLLGCRWPKTALKIETITTGGNAKPTDGNEA
ncbi:TIGR02594 family protein, partial [Rhizobium sp. KVB221]|nr:TIGR02594 family protein [Rhizobium setariae]MBL0375546.1 TIGR02594 family protein [Rhizobium setariae]